MTRIFLQVRGKEATLGHFVDHQINKPKWEAWKFLPEAVQQGEVAFALAHGGLDMHQVSHWPLLPGIPLAGYCLGTGVRTFVHLQQG